MAAETTTMNSSLGKDKTDRVRMKDCPDLYYASNAGVKADVLHFLDQYKSKMNWKEHGGRSVDLGCADGHTTSILAQFVPPTYEMLVGCDINTRSVRSANEKYGSEKLQFRILDIEGNLPPSMREEFDHVFSFYAVNWVPDQKKAFGNVFELLVEGGDCLLLVLGYHPIFTMYLALAEDSKWADYLKNVHNFVSPYFSCQEPDLKIAELMNDIGFSYADVKCKQLNCTYSSVDVFKKLLYAIDPFGIPEELMAEFLADAEHVVRGMRLLHKGDDGTELVKCHYNLLVIHGRK